jgi:hypothetical protein
MWLSQAKHTALLLILASLLPSLAGCASQRHFASPDAAVSDLVKSFRLSDQFALMHILGAQADDLLFSGDPNVDRATVDRFLTAYDQKHQLIMNKDGTVTLCVGKESWPMPIPLVKGRQSEKWFFDTASGKDEILNRRIGRDELDTIQSCLAIVDAQREYAQIDPQRLGVPCYAQKFLSDPGQKNGLFWQTAEGEPVSPLGDLVGSAESQGYSLKTPSKGPRPYHGYVYRILKAQGPDAPGGARDYILDGKMIGGFAVIATPATYGNSGIMTFIVSHDGDVYQRDLGPDTAKVAAKITAFNPDSNWKKIASASSVPAITEAR